MTLKDRRRRNAIKLADTCKDDADFASRVGITPSYASQILNRRGTADKPKGIGEHITHRITRAFDLPEGWLDHDHNDGGIVSLGGDRIGSPKQQEVGPGPDNVLKVPLLPWSSVGHWIDSEGDLSSVEYIQPLLCPIPSHGPLTFVLEVRGASMEPTYHAGEYIFVDPSRVVTTGAHVVAKLEGQAEPVFRRFIYEGGSAYLEALNPAWPDRFIPVLPSTRILGAVIFTGHPV